MRIIRIVVPKLNVSEAQFKRFVEVNTMARDNTHLWLKLSRGDRTMHSFVHQSLRARRSTLDGCWLENSSDVIEILRDKGVPKEEATKAAQGINELLDTYEGGTVDIVFHPTPHREPSSMELRH